MRFIEPVMPRKAKGLAAATYREIKRDFGLLRDPNGHSPWMILSPHAELLAGFWIACYETVLVEGELDRIEKEAIATAVSRLNECAFCLDAHAFLGEVAATESPAKGTRTAGLTAWAAATRQPASILATTPPFNPAQAPEAIGTALIFHTVNRVVHFFQGTVGLEMGPTLLRRITTAVATRVARRALRRAHTPGRSLPLLPEAALPPDLGWASPSPTIAAGLARSAAVIDQAGQKVLSPDERDYLLKALARWDGSEPPLGRAWIDGPLDDLDPRSRPAARVIGYAAFAPSRVDAEAVTAFRRHRPDDRELVAAVTWSAFQTARHISSWLTQTADSEWAKSPGRGAVRASPVAATTMKT